MFTDEKSGVKMFVKVVVYEKINCIFFIKKKKEKKKG